MVDKVPEHRTPPSPEAIEKAREKQLDALREVRRILKQAHAFTVKPHAIAG
jgi:hypothetical protein